MNNILFIHHVSFLGGAERHLLSMIEALDKKFKVFFICQEPGPLSEALISRGVVVKYLSLGPWRKVQYLIKNLLTIKDIIKFCKENKINLICSNSYRVSSYATIPGKFLQIPTITIVQDFVTKEKLTKFNALKSDMLITVSDSISCNIRPFFSKKIVRVYNGLDADVFFLNAGSEERLRREFPVLKDKLIVGMIAQVVPIKGHKFFLNAMKEIAKDFPNVMFVIVGDSPDPKQLSLDDIKSYARELQLEDRVIFTGARPDVAAILKSFDIFVLPSLKEPFGRVIMEAMAVSVPVVATSCGGPSEIIEDNQSGLLVPVGDEQSLIQKVAELLKDEAKRKNFGIQGRQRVQKYFNLKETVGRINQIFTEIL